MNIATHAQSLYDQNRSLKTPRDLEYEVFARITGRLKTATAPERNHLTPALIAALYDNRRLWTTLAMDLAHPDNGLAQDLRARLVYLAEFTLITTNRLLGAPAAIADGVASLIEINTAIMRGLRGEVSK